MYPHGLLYDKDNEGALMHTGEGDIEDKEKTPSTAKGGVGKGKEKMASIAKREAQRGIRHDVHDF
jgi:hypothetical protein